jgi:predicted TIM-barrel fold metal-dependent hydrolase
MITDLHLHFCDSSRYTQLKTYCSISGIDRAALISIPHLEVETFNEAVLFAVERNPDRFIGFGALDHRKGNYGRQVEEMKLAGFTGLKIWIGKPMVEKRFGRNPRDKSLQEAFSAASELSMPVLYHAADPPDFWDPEGIYDEDNFDPFERYIEDAVFCAESFPGVTFIIAHMFFLAGGLDKLSDILIKHPNIFLDLAPGRWFYYPLAKDPEKTRVFFKEFNTRIFLGSDVMFFPKSFREFSYVSLEANLQTAGRIISFISRNQLVDNPYPGTASDHPSIAGLSLDKESLKNIFSKNADQFFLKKGRPL